jgi:hypothetical protein
MSSRTGRSSANRLVTCLEASEMGYDFVKTCGRCDYYLQNRSLNNKSLTLPRSQLSKLWQCTSYHKVGDLFYSQCSQTPYQPIKPTKMNSFICSDHSSQSRSATKRVRLFEPSTPYMNVENETPLSVQSLQVPNKEQHHDSLKIDLAIAERNRAFAERDKAAAERDFAFVERDKAYSKSDAAKAECYRAIVQRDQALDDLDLVVQESKLMQEKLLHWKKRLKR